MNTTITNDIMGTGNTNTQNQIVRRCEVWYVNFGSNSNNNSRIQGAIRPAIIVSNNKCNEMSPVITVVALTSNLTKATMKKMPTHVFISKNCGLDVDSIALCEQPRSIDKTQLLSKICKIDNETMLNIENAVKIQLGMQEQNSAQTTINNQNKIDTMDINYLKDLIISINQLNVLQKQLNTPIEAKKILLENFIEYCKKYGQDHKIVFTQIKNKMFNKRVESVHTINMYNTCHVPHNICSTVTN